MRTALILLAPLAVLALALPAAAPAQTRNCFTGMNGRITCVDSYEHAVERIERRTRDLPAAQPTPPPDDTPTPYITPAERRLVAAVLRQVLRGRCDKAEAIALKAGDKELAQAAVLRCTPAGAQPGG
jgi:hypothetical protein